MLKVEIIFFARAKPAFSRGLFETDKVKENINCYLTSCVNAPNYNSSNNNDINNDNSSTNNN